MHCTPLPSLSNPGASAAFIETRTHLRRQHNTESGQSVYTQLYLQATDKACVEMEFEDGDSAILVSLPESSDNHSCRTPEADILV